MKRFIKVLSVIVVVIMLSGCFAPDVPPSQVDTETADAVLFESPDELSAEPSSTPSSETPAEKTSDEDNVTEEENIDVTVYITDTGKKYHQENCQYLRMSCRRISLERAILLYYTPCSVCSP